MSEQPKIEVYDFRDISPKEMKEYFLNQSIKVENEYIPLYKIVQFCMYPYRKCKNSYYGMICGVDTTKISGKVSYKVQYKEYGVLKFVDINSNDILKVYDD